MPDSVTFVALDVHKESISVAESYPGSDGLTESRIPNTEQSIKRLVRSVSRRANGDVRFCYEAGALGYSIQRLIHNSAPGVSCTVVAPSRIPLAHRRHLKTDRLDARRLVNLFELGLLTEVCPPTPAEEAVRDLCRCRARGKTDLVRARHRLRKFLLRRNIIRPGATGWSKGHREWLSTLEFEHEPEQLAFADYLLAADEVDARLAHIDCALAEIASSKPYQERVGWLRCFRGIDTLSAMVLLAELHDPRRFASAPQLTSYLGLTPCVYASGASCRCGGISRAGNTHVRRLLVEAAFHYQVPRPVSRALESRRMGQPEWVVRHADRARDRLTRRYRSLRERGKSSKLATVAVARELAGFVWFVLSSDDGKLRSGRSSVWGGSGLPVGL